MLGIIFFLSTLLFGFGLSYYVRFFDDLIKKTAFSIIAGALASCWITFIFSLLLGSIDYEAILFSYTLMALSGISLLYFKKKDIRKGISFEADIYLVITLAILLPILYYFNHHAIGYDRNGNIIAITNVWGDYAFHMTLINHLLEDFNLKYPILVNTPLHYPFMVDFLSAVYKKCGLDLIQSLTWVNLLLLFGLLLTLYLFTKEVLGKGIGIIIAPLLFLLNGGLGFIYASKKGLKEFLYPTMPYSHLPAQGIEFMNTLFAIFIPERGIILGFSIVLLTFLFLYGDIKKPSNTDSPPKGDSTSSIIMGCIVGLLPFIHAHCFLVVSFVAAFIAGLNCLTSSERLSELKRWAYFFLPLVILSLPQIIFFMKGSSTGVIHLSPGWMAKSSNVLVVASFWFMNIGVPLILAIIGIFMADRTILRFYLPLTSLFLLGNIISFQNWDWDNIKIFLPWFFITTILASYPLVRLYQRGIRARAIVLMLIFFSILSGILTLNWWNRDVNILFSSRDIALADWIKGNTPPDAVFLTGDAHNHPVPCLTGRQIVMGYPAWIWSHGLDPKEVERDVKEIYKTGDLSLLRKYRVRYIVVSPYEMNLNPIFFEGLKDFVKVYDDYRYKVFEMAK